MLVKTAQTLELVPVLPVKVYVTVPMEALMYWLSRVTLSCSNSTLIIPSISLGMVNSTTRAAVASSLFFCPLTVKMIFVPPETSLVGLMLCSITWPWGAKLNAS